MEDKPIYLGDKVKGEIDLPTIDVSEYVGKRTKIEEVLEFESTQFAKEGEKNYYIKVLSAPLGEIETADGTKELRASRIFGLQTDKEGNIGWGAQTKLGLFLKKMKVEHYNDLIGKEIVVQTHTSKDGKDYLTFN